MSDLKDKTWRELSEAASREKDPQKLLELIKALNYALERREQLEKAKRNQCPPLGSLFQMRGRTAQAA